jgi:hypothetical protein
MTANNALTGNGKPRAIPMESSYSIQPVERLVRMQVCGELTVDGLIELIDRIGADEHYQSGMHAIADFRQSVGNWDYSEIQRYRDYLARIAGRRDCRWAALVKPGTLLAVGHVLIVISEAIRGSIELQLFEDPQVALRWVQGEFD